MRAYFDKNATAFDRLPFKNKRPELGIFPLCKYFYQPCKESDTGSMSVLNGAKFVKVTEAGSKWKIELATVGSEHRKYFDENTYLWGETSGTCMPTYDNMLFYPKKAVDVIRMYGEAFNASTDSTKLKCIDPPTYKKLIKRSKKWTRANQKIWSKIVRHLTNAAVNICDGIEPSNGIVLLATIISKFGNTHAQCLAAMLRILTNIKMLAKDPSTSQPETVADYFLRVQRIARDASSFPSMKVPIAAPLIKVFALEGLIKTDAKYKSMVTMAYANDLADSIEKLTSQMQTVEGLRESNMQRQYAGTNLASASVQKAAGSRRNQNRNSNGGTKPKGSGRGPNDPCYLRNHKGHTVKQCQTIKLNKMRDNGTIARAAYDKNGDKICDYLNNNLRCPFGKKCKNSHKYNEARAYKTDGHDSDDSDSSYERERHRRRNKKKKKKSKRKSKKAKIKAALAALSLSETDDSDTDSSDFL